MSAVQKIAQRFTTSEDAAKSVNPNAKYVQCMEDAEEWECPDGTTIEINFAFPNTAEEWLMIPPPAYVGWYIESITPF